MSYGGFSNFMFLLVEFKILTTELALSTTARHPVRRRVHPVIKGVLSLGDGGSISSLPKRVSLGFNIGVYKQSIKSLNRISCGNVTTLSWCNKRASSRIKSDLNHNFVPP